MSHETPPVTRVLRPRTLALFLLVKTAAAATDVTRGDCETSTTVLHLPQVTVYLARRLWLKERGSAHLPLGCGEHALTPQQWSYNAAAVLRVHLLVHPPPATCPLMNRALSSHLTFQRPQLYNCTFMSLFLGFLQRSEPYVKQKKKARSHLLPQLQWGDSRVSGKQRNIRHLLRFAELILILPVSFSKQCGS